MSYELKWEDEGYYLHMWGTVTADDMNDALADIWRNPKSDSMKYCIRDYLDVTKVNIGMSRQHVSLFVSTYEKHAAENCRNLLKRIAFLSKNDDMDKIIEGYTQAMKGHSPTTEFRNFDSVEDSRKWVSELLQANDSTA